jgi:Protein of unknown function (DUF998)
MSSRIALVCATLGVLFALLLALLGGAYFPGYSHAAQFISELGARQAPHEQLVRWVGFLPAGVLILGFSAAAFFALPRSALTTFGLLGVAVYAGGYVAAAFFPCDPGCRPSQPSISQLIHNLAGLAGYVLAPLFLAALASSARRWPGGGYLVVAGFVAAGLSLLGMLSLSPNSPYVGWSQRLIEASVLLWVLLCAWYLWRRGKNAA